MLYATTVIVDICIAVKIIAELYVLFARFVFKHNVDNLHGFSFSETFSVVGFSTKRPKKNRHSVRDQYFERYNVKPFDKIRKKL